MVAVGGGVEVAVGTVGVRDGVGGSGVSVAVAVGGAGVRDGVEDGGRVGSAILPLTTAPALLRPITPTRDKIATRLPRV